VPSRAQDRRAVVGRVDLRRGHGQAKTSGGPPRAPDLGRPAPSRARYEIGGRQGQLEWDTFRKLIEAEHRWRRRHRHRLGDTIVLAAPSRAPTIPNACRPGANPGQDRDHLLKAPPPPIRARFLLQSEVRRVDRTALTQWGFNLFSLNGKMIGGTGTEQFTPPRFHGISGQTILPPTRSIFPIS